MLYVTNLVKVIITFRYLATDVVVVLVAVVYIQQL